MAWQTPKTDWGINQQGVEDTDFNRIEGNTQWLYDNREPIFTKNTAFNKNFGTTTGTVGDGAVLAGKEPAFAKNTAFNKNFGTTTGTVGDGAVLAGKEPAFTKNTAFNKNFGTTAGTVAEGNLIRGIHLIADAPFPAFAGGSQVTIPDWNLISAVPPTMVEVIYNGVRNYTASVTRIDGTDLIVEFTPLGAGTLNVRAFEYVA